MSARTAAPSTVPSGGAHMKNEWREARSSILVGVVMFGLLATCLGGFLATMPRPKDEDMKLLLANFPPRNLGAISAVRDVLVTYGAAHPWRVGVALALVYITMQTFAIPGTISLSLLAGAFFGRINGFMLVCLISTLGSSTCYALSWAVGRPLVHAIWPQRLESFRKEVAKRKHELFNYILFLRVTPILPNTFINVASPIVGVPLSTFTIGTLLGCAPNNFIAANAGAHLGELESLQELYDPRMIVLMIVVGVIAIVPIFWRRKHEASQNKQQDEPGSKKEL